MTTDKKFFRGCLLGGAIGGAFGWLVDFLFDGEIKMEHESKGIIDLIIGEKGKADITDDTQMTLFTAEGLLAAAKDGMSDDSVRYVYEAYLAWLYTQGEGSIDESFSKFSLLKEKELFADRAPGLTCVEALKSGIMGTMEIAINDNKGSGGIIRVAPVGLMYPSKRAFQMGCECAAITHGDFSGYIPAGMFACIIAEIICGNDIEGAVKTALHIAKDYEGHEECTAAVKKALYLAKEQINPKMAISKIGEGWAGEEALAIAIYCSLKYKNEFDKAIIASVDHHGDSDITGGITGNILGAYLGVDKIPEIWIEQLELSEVITRIADDIYYTNSKS